MCALKKMRDQLQIGGFKLDYMEISHFRGRDVEDFRAAAWSEIYE